MTHFSSPGNVIYSIRSPVAENGSRANGRRKQRCSQLMAHTPGQRRGLATKEDFQSAKDILGRKKPRTAKGSRSQWNATRLAGVSLDHHGLSREQGPGDQYFQTGAGGLTRFGSLRAKAKLAGEQTANYQSYRCRPVTIHFQRNDREAQEDSEFEKYLQAQKGKPQCNQSTSVAAYSQQRSLSAVNNQQILVAQ